MASSSLAILWSSVVSCGARSDEVAGEIGLGKRAKLCLQRRDFILQCFQARRVRGLLRGERAVDLALQFLLDVADLGVERGGVGDRAAILGGLGERVQRFFEARHAGGELGDIRRRLHLALFQCLDPRIERPERLGVASRRRRRFELGETALERGQVRRIRRAKRDHVPGKGQADHADQAAEQPCGEMGHEALELGRARPWRRAFGPLRLRSFGIGCASASTAGSGDAASSGAGSIAGDAISSGAGSTVTSVAVPSMVGAGRLPEPALIWSPNVSAMTPTVDLRIVDLTRMPPRVR